MLAGAGQYVGRTLATLVSFYNPGLVVLGSDVAATMSCTRFARPLSSSRASLATRTLRTNGPPWATTPDPGRHPPDAGSLVLRGMRRPLAAVLTGRSPRGHGTPAFRVTRWLTSTNCGGLARHRTKLGRAWWHWMTATLMPTGYGSTSNGFIESGFAGCSCSTAEWERRLVVPERMRYGSPACVTPSGWRRRRRTSSDSSSPSQRPRAGALLVDPGSIRLMR